MEPKKMMPGLSVQAFKRMPYYLQYLKELQSEGTLTISAPVVSAHFSFNEVQVRKDFAAVSTAQGKPKSGFDVNELINGIENILGYRNTDEAVLVGVGSLGTALLQYNGFNSYGLKIIAAFDRNDDTIGTTINDKQIYSVSKVSEFCRRMNIRIGIITVPASEAQVVCYQLVAGGVQAIWNFAPVHLSVPEGILVQNENMAASLALLSKHLREKLRKDGK